MATPTQAVEDPQAVIWQIREDFGIDNNGQVTRSKPIKMLEKSLRVIAEQLNTDPSHFVLEAIQNADDNFYSSVAPLLCITLGESEVLISSNEMGFNRSNVNAICSISESTKAGRADCTGEKGIGFKSFFKIATTVHISSRGYNFQFDANRLCGMVIPEWKLFPGRYYQPQMTQFLLKLKNDAPRALIEADMRAIAPTHLFISSQTQKTGSLRWRPCMSNNAQGY